MVFGSSSGSLMPMLIVRCAWASRSIRRTRCSRSARAAPRLTAVVVLPTPPFWLATEITRAIRARVYPKPPTQPRGGAHTCPYNSRDVSHPAAGGTGRPRLRSVGASAVRAAAAALPGCLGLRAAPFWRRRTLRSRRRLGRLDPRGVPRLLPPGRHPQRRLAGLRLDLHPEPPSGARRGDRHGPCHRGRGAGGGDVADGRPPPG